MRRRGGLLAGLLALLPAVSQAAMFMLVDGVPGPSKYTNYGGWFSVDSAQWFIDRTKAGEPHSIVVTLRSSAQTAALIQLSASGAILKRIVVDHVSTSEAAPVLNNRLTCDDAQIRSSSTSGDSDDIAQIELKILCGRLAWENFDYNAQKTLAAQGKGSWNFKTNTPQ
jgi:hypothetical protein